MKRSVLGCCYNTWYKNLVDASEIFFYELISITTTALLSTMVYYVIKYTNMYIGLAVLTSKLIYTFFRKSYRKPRLHLCFACNSATRNHKPLNKIHFFRSKLSIPYVREQFRLTTSSNSAHKISCISIFVVHGFFVCFSHRLYVLKSLLWKVFKFSIVAAPKIILSSDI